MAIGFVAYISWMLRCPRQGSWAGPRSPSPSPDTTVRAVVGIGYAAAAGLVAQPRVRPVRTIRAGP